MRLRYFIIISVFFLLAFTVSAQELHTIKGVVSKRLSGERIANVLINNLRTRNIVETDQLGWFTASAAIGDTLLFSKPDYTDQKIVIASANDLPVYMQPVIKLDQVTIKGQTKKEEINDVMKDYRRQGTYYDGKPPVLSFLTNPLTGLYELFGSAPGKARRFAAASKGDLEYSEVHRRYNVAFVKRITNATDTVAVNFMKYYTPSAEDLKEWNDYELIRRTKKSYDFYDKASPKEKIKLENLNTPPILQPLKTEEQ
jgi:hypothetical protein